MELWKEFAPYYDISNKGTVRSRRWSPARILKQRRTRNGYMQVRIKLNGETVPFSIHRLVAEIFVPNPDNKPQVNHCNGIKTDNRAENLEWCTASENKLHAVSTGLQHILQGEKCPWAKLTDAQALYIRNNPDEMTQAQLAKKFNVSRTTICNIQRGERRKSAGGVARDKIEVRLPNNVRDEIRRLYKRSIRGCGAFSLAKKFGVSKTTIQRILRETTT